MSNICCGWDKDIENDPVEFCYGHDDFCYCNGVKTPFYVFYAKGVLPIDELTEEFIKKLTFQDKYRVIEESGKAWRVLGDVEGLTLKYERPTPKDYRDIYIQAGLPDPGPILTIEEPTFYDIVKDNEKWRISIIGPDEARVQQAVKRINSRLLGD